MSFVTDQVRRIDAQLDRLQLAAASSSSTPGSPVLRATSRASRGSLVEIDQAKAFARVQALQSVIKSLSATSSAQPILPNSSLQLLLEQAESLHVDSKAIGEGQTLGSYEQELEWLLVSKATTQTYGLILNSLLEQTLPLSNDIWYWDEVLGSYAYTSIYTVQTSPLRFWGWSKDIYHDARERLEALRGHGEISEQESTTITNRWRQFYGLVKDSIRDRSIADMQSKVMSPLIMCRTEARHKQKSLKKLRELSASGLGVLMDECLTFDMDDEDSALAKMRSNNGSKEEWKSIVSKSVTLMETVLRNITTLEAGVNEFEDLVFTAVEEDPEILPPGDEMSSRPQMLAEKLQQILSVHMPSHVTASKKLAQEYGRPSRLIRYWLPAGLLFLSSSTLLRIAVNRKAELLTWIQDLGATTVDFWYNWIVEPVKKVIGTIRHDKDSEIAIMSKESLQGDRASLERMVVDFAIDNPETTVGTPLTEADIAIVRAKVREGDLTPVLRAYERDLRKPFVGTIRGHLVRALLIQVQKTKVDVEVAMGGIDALLKSQELVFGFVGLTPGVLVCFGVARWLSSLFGGRKGKTKGKKQSRMIRVLRNIDRILSASTPSNNGMLSYKEHGLLLCEVHILRQTAQHVLPGEINREFLEEINDLVDIRTGVDRQLRVVERMRWAYSKWLQ